MIRGPQLGERDELLYSSVLSMLCVAYSIVSGNDVCSVLHTALLVVMMQLTGAVDACESSFCECC